MDACGSKEAVLLPGKENCRIQRFCTVDISGKDNMKDEQNLKLCSSTFNHDVIVKDPRECNERTGRYPSTKELLLDDMEAVSNARHAEARAAVDLWLGWIAAALHLEDSAMEVVRLQKTGA